MQEDQDICTKCDGAGWIWGYELSKDPDYETDQRYTCDSCAGNGYLKFCEECGSQITSYNESNFHRNFCVYCEINDRI